MPAFTTNAWRPDVCGCEINSFMPMVPDPTPDHPEHMSPDPRAKPQYLSPADHPRLLPEVFEARREGVVHRTTGRVIREAVCPAHQGLSGQALHDALLKECSSKERVFGYYVGVVGNLCSSCYAPLIAKRCRQCGETPRDCGALGACPNRRAFIFRWEFDKDRNLVASFRNAAQADLDRTKALIDRSLGHGRTVVKSF